MLIIDVEEQEFYDGRKEMFFRTKPITVRMEHSLISIAKWEAVWKKPYLATPSATQGVFGLAEEQHYIQCMIIGSVPDHIPGVLLQNHLEKIRTYINDPQSATTIHRRGGNLPSRQIVTVELIYYWMIKFAIPFECQRWHFNRLLMLIDVCSIKDSGGKAGKLSAMETANYNQQLNKLRREAK